MPRLLAVTALIAMITARRCGWRASTETRSGPAAAS